MEFNYRGKHYILGEMYIFINYFYEADDEDENLIKIAKEYIDMKEGKR